MKTFETDEVLGRLVESVCDGRASLGCSLQGDDGRFVAYDGNGQFLGWYASRKAARAAIINADCAEGDV